MNALNTKKSDDDPIIQNEITLKDLSEVMYLTNIPDEELLKSQMLPIDLTIKEKDTYKFWDILKKPQYQQLSWLPNNNFQNLEENILDGYISTIEQKSWFSIQTIKPSLMITSQSYKFTVVDGIEKEDILKKQKIVKAYKLKLKPNKEQKILLNKFIGCYRYTYNKVINALNNDKDTLKCNDFLKFRNRFVTEKSNNVRRKENDSKKESSKTKKKTTKKTTKKKTTKKKRKKKKQLGKTNNFFDNKKWLLDCPKMIRQSACEQACNSFKSALTNLSNGNIKHFFVRYLSKKRHKENGWSVAVEKTAIKKKDNKLFIFTKSLGEMKYCNTKQLNKFITKENPDKDCFFQKDKYGDYYLVIPIESDIVKPINGNKVVSIDPGIRKFITTYSPNERESLFIGKDYEEKIISQLETLDEYYSLRTTLSNNENVSKETKNKVSEKIIKLRKRVDNLKTELNHQVSNLISKKYDIILMPHLDVLQLSSKKNGRKLRTKVVRQMMNLRHGDFFNKLKLKCYARGKTFMKVSEAYTSQTCPNCGVCKVSSSETKKCNECLFTFDRDIVGAYNILIKALRLKAPV